MIGLLRFAWRAAAALWVAGLLVPAAHAAPEMAPFADFERVSARRVSRAVVEFEYRAVVSLPDASAVGVRATVSSTRSGTTVVDGSLDFGDLGSPGIYESLDTFVFRQDRRVPFDPAALAFELTSENRPPVARAGPDQTVTLGGIVHLDGSASSDADGDALVFDWTIASAPVGSVATLSDPTAVQPEFEVDVAGRYVVELVVHDGLAPSPVDSVTIDTANSLPTANAGPDQTVTVGRIVDLDGSASTDPDGDLLGYRWRFVAVPNGSTAALSNAGAIMPHFTVDRPGRYEIELIVDDGTGESPPDLVFVDTENSAPVADPGPNQTVRVGDIARLDGTASNDVDGDPLGFSWALIARPAGSAAELDDPSATNPGFAVDRPGSYVAQLIVNDGVLDSAPTTVTVVTENSPPVAFAGPDQTASLGLIRLDGSLSSDVDGDPLTYAWSLIAVPDGSSATLAAPDAVVTDFVADLVGNYVVQLIVSDGALQSAPDTLLVRINSLPGLSMFVPGEVGAGLQVMGSGRLGVGNHGGVLVRIESADPTALLISDDPGMAGGRSVDVFVPDGIRDFDFVLQGVPRESGLVEVAVSAPGFVAATREVEISPPAVSFSGLGSLASAGTSDGFTVFTGVSDASGTGISSFQGASAAALPQTLTLRTDDATVGDVSLGGGTGSAVTLDLAAGDFQTVASFNALATGVVAVSAELSDSGLLASRSQSVTVDAPDLGAFSRTIGAGLQYTSQATLAIRNHGGVTVRVESADPGLALVSADQLTPGSAAIDVFVPDGSDRFEYTVQGVADSVGTTTVTLSAPGFDSGTGTVTVGQPGILLTGLGTDHTIGGTDAFTLLTGLVNSAGTALSSFQRVSAANDLELTLEVVDPAVGELDFDGQTGAVVTRTLVAPEFQFTAVFRALGEGTTSVRASIPGFLLVPGEVDVLVSPP
ncbi:MAG TPA: hypothetical protein ENI85_15220 [Deltaproteobacteria bacterium]|nr:hypothetical protein [Deltaproteobacteria bacterium]